MSIFTLKKIEAVAGKQEFFELLIDGKSQYEEFHLEISEQTTYVSELKTILSYMSFVAELRMLPQSKFRDITPSNDNVKEYEFKSKHLRVYTFHLEKTGKVVAFWGYKNTQKEDIIKFRSLKKQYIASISQ